MSQKQIKIKADYISKKFELLSSGSSKTKTKPSFATHNQQTDFWALRNINLTLDDGECVGVIGLNGAGKSTLSNIISGQIQQTMGNILVNGKVSIIANSAGLQGNLTGRENIQLKCLMLGMTNKEVKEKIDEIIEFSELDEFIDQPIKSYSSGMKAKLGFSISVHQNPDIMIIDEGLATGDQTFNTKAKNKMFEFRKMGKTILLVSHNMGDIREWCDKVIWLNYGEVMAYGKTEEVVQQYLGFIKWFNALSKEEQKIQKYTWREEQLNYSKEKIIRDISENKKIKTRNQRQTIKKSLLKTKDNHKMSLLSKIFIILCLFTVLWIDLVALSEVNFAASVKQPTNFFEHHLFKSKNVLLAQKPKNTPQKPSSQQSMKNQSNTMTSLQSSATPQKATDKIETYTIQPGDVLSQIAISYNTTIEEIELANPGINLNLITPGQVINLPNSFQGALTTTESSPQ